jgi:hypothetical protein
MPSPLDFIQTLSQKGLSGKKAGPETSALTGESGNQAEAFSSALNQALQPMSQQQAPQPSQPEISLNGMAAEVEQPGDPSTPKAEDANPVLLPAELLALQPISVFIELAPPPAGLTQALSQRAMETTLNLPSSQPIQPELQPTQPEIQPETQPLIQQGPIQNTTPILATLPSQSLPKTLAIPSGIPSRMTVKTAQGTENPPEKTENLPQKDVEQDTVMLAQSLGLSTLSPEAMLMMGIPVEFQIQNATPPIQTQQTPASPASSIDAPQPLLQTVPQEAPIPSYSPAKLELDASLPIPVQANESSSTFDQALKQASQEPEVPELAATKTTTPTMNLESTLVIEDTMMQSEMPAMAPMLELPNGPDSLQFNQILTEAGPKMLDSEDKSTAEPRLKTLEEATALPLQNETGATVQTTAQPTPPPQNVEALLNPFARIQQTLETLNGQIESIGEPSSSMNRNSFEKSALPEEVPSEAQIPTLAMSSDIQAPIRLNENVPLNISGKVPQFVSSAVDPADQVVDGTVYSVKNGHQELILKINPDNLGEVRINLTSRGENGLNARLIASNPESHALLKTQVNTLKASLEAQGVHVERLSVVLAGQTETSSNAGKQEQPQSQYPQQQSSSASQQQSFQQPEQNLNAFFQSGGSYPNKQGFAQNPGSGGYRQSGAGNDTPSSIPESPIRRNDNGSVSVLA